MKIIIINGTSYKGCTYQMKEMFLNSMGLDNDIVEYYLPKDSPNFCTGCKTCFNKDISACPHSKYTSPIWDSIINSDLIVFTSPVYVFHVVGQVKALLDHFGTKWMAHSPAKEMFTKKAVIITNAVGQGMNNVIKDIGDSLDFWGIAKRYSIKQALYDIDWSKVSLKRKNNIKKQCDKISKKVQKEIKKPRLKIRILFTVMSIAQKLIHKSLVKKGDPSTTDYLYWKENGWLDGKKPWK
ncbi:MAG: NAD(P)H-dependent oxidoreductase [Acholeplasmatales bacterium]|jgi:multimeric flavodoxin WrbA|nr:NAD(P)H-dependent oxidoreductase [Acholeplasmatales bacterium]